MSKRSFYQGRLGTNIGKVEKKRVAFSREPLREVLRNVGPVPVYGPFLEWLGKETRPFALPFTANCTIIDHFSAFESGLVAPFLYDYCAIRSTYKMHHFTKTGSGQT